MVAIRACDTTPSKCRRGRNAVIRRHSILLALAERATRCITSTANLGIERGTPRRVESRIQQLPPGRKKGGTARPVEQPVPLRSCAAAVLPRQLYGALSRHCAGGPKWPLRKLCLAPQLVDTAVFAENEKNEKRLAEPLCRSRGPSPFFGSQGPAWSSVVASEGRQAIRSKRGRRAGLERLRGGRSSSSQPLGCSRCRLLASSLI